MNVKKKVRVHSEADRRIKVKEIIFCCEMVKWLTLTLSTYVAAFYYKLGDSGANYVLKENYRVPYVDAEFLSLSKMKLYIT